MLKSFLYFLWYVKRLPNFSEILENHPQEFIHNLSKINSLKLLFWYFSIIFLILIQNILPSFTKFSRSFQNIIHLNVGTKASMKLFQNIVRTVSEFLQFFQKFISKSEKNVLIFSELFKIFKNLLKIISKLL